MMTPAPAVRWRFTIVTAMPRAVIDADAVPPARRLGDEIGSALHECLRPVRLRDQGVIAVVGKLRLRPALGPVVVNGEMIDEIDAAAKRLQKHGVPAVLEAAGNEFG